MSPATAKMNASWAAFFKKAHIVPHIGERYTETLTHDAGVGNTDRLKKKVEKNLKFLVEHGFDDDDVDGITKALSDKLKPQRLEGNLSLAWTIYTPVRNLLPATPRSLS